MTEAEDKDHDEPEEEYEIELFNEKFEGKSYSFIIDDNKKIYMTPEEIGKALDYDRPKKGIENILERHVDEFKDKIKHFPVSQSGTPIKTLNKDGLLLVGMFSRQPKAKLVRVWILDVVNKYETLTSNLKDPYEQRKIILEMLMTINEEQRGLKDTVQELEEKYLTLTKKLNGAYLSFDNRDKLIAMIHQIHLNNGKPHGVIYKDLYDTFDVPRPKSNLKRINFVLDAQFPAMKKYLENKYKLLSFFMNASE
jgi:prophage antirepressor-like protein